MKKYLVVGDPIAHSRSPGMQNAAFEKYGLGRPYGRMRIPPEELADFFEYARQHFLGVNLTVPHKTAAAQLADELSERAAVSGSVNTLLIRNGRIYGDTTDGIGLERAIAADFGLQIPNNIFTILGAGGAARAAAIHFALNGAAEIIIINRTLARAEAVKADILKNIPQAVITTLPLSAAAETASALRRSAALIQMTSLGLKPEDPPPLPPELLNGDLKLAIFDTIYHETPLQKQAAQAGLPVAGGRDMLIHQGAASFELWTGLPAPLEEMQRGFEEPINSGDDII